MTVAGDPRDLVYPLANSVAQHQPDGGTTPRGSDGEVDASKREVHGALIDSELLAIVYLAMTGGQATLLLDEEADVGSRSRSTGPRSRLTGARLARDESRARRAPTNSNAAGDARRTPTIIIKASDEEAAAHDAMLEKIRKSGACVWDFD